MCPEAFARTRKVDVNALTVKDLVITRVGHNILPIFGPVQVSDEAGVTLSEKLYGVYIHTYTRQ